VVGESTLAFLAGVHVEGISVGIVAPNLLLRMGLSKFIHLTAMV